MLYIYEEPTTVEEAYKTLRDLAQQARQVQFPGNNRRRLGQRRNTINTYYDCLTALAHYNGNDKSLDSKLQQKWKDISAKVKRDRKLIVMSKESIQQDTEGFVF